MNYTLHQFKKEWLYLRPWWLAWLGLLALLLVYRMEWVSPLIAEPTQSLAPTPKFWLLVTAWICLAAGCPEDRPSLPGRFSATLPMPAASYFLAKIAVLVLMFLLPMVLENAVYLWLSDRSIGTIGSGSLGYAAQCLMWLGPVLPLCYLFPTGPQFCVAGLISCTCLELSWALIHKTPYASMPRLEWFTGGLGLLLLLIASVHRRVELGFATRLIALTVSCALALWIQSPLHQLVHETRGVDRSKAISLAAAYAPRLSEDRWEITGLGSDSRSLVSRIQIPQLPQGITVDTVVKDIKLSRAGEAIPCKPSREDPPLRLAGLVKLLPENTVLIPSRMGWWRSDRETLANFTTALGTEPLDVSCQVGCQWREWKEIAELPLKVGAEASSGQSWMRIEAVGSEGLTADVNLTVRRHLQDPATELCFVIYAKKRGAAWPLEHRRYLFQERSTETAWQHHLGLYHAAVLNYSDGSRACELADLSLRVFQCRLLGETEHLLTASQVVPKDSGGSPPRLDRMHEMDELAFARARLRELPAPPPNAPEAEHIQPILQVTRLCLALGNRKHGVVDLCVGSLRHYLPQQLALLLRLPDSAFQTGSPKAPVFELLRQHLATDELRQLLPRMVERPWIAALACERGLAAEVPAEIRALILKVKRPDADFLNIMAEWDDPATLAHRLALLKENPTLLEFRRLWLHEALRSELTQLADQWWRHLEPVAILKSPGGIQCAAALGNAQALDLAIRWALLDAPRNVKDGLRELLNFGPNWSLVASVRYLGAADFTYDASTLSWRKNP
jgi:hypothetical protein